MSYIHLVDENFKHDEFYNEFKLETPGTTLYQYLIIYLHQDTKMLLHLIKAIILSFENQNINFLAQFKYTISSIAFNEILIRSQLQNIDNVAPFVTDSSFINKSLKQSVLGGYTTCCVHGTIDSSTTINENFQIPPNVCPKIWPNFYDQNLKFDKKCKKILGLDVRSLYATSMSQVQRIFRGGGNTRY